MYYSTNSEIIMSKPRFSQDAKTHYSISQEGRKGVMNDVVVF